ncbi:hypothetical protein ACFORO_42615 [Amycolatopsis halotolerans]|uniref:Uncharacterized protein n=1 Tax=Amycolatopsis halotolerans TaxID=330083 RepID=A0ABV7QUB7_9PSEU
MSKVEVISAGCTTLVLNVAVKTLCVWGIVAILGLSLGFWPLVGLGALVYVLLPASSND